MPARLHPAEQYARDVVHGRVIACRWVRQACQRHLNDLKTGAERGLVFDAKAAQRALNFIGLLCHSKGEWAGQPLRLEPWQQFITWCIFGWKRSPHPRWVVERNGQKEDTAGTRRFRTVYIEIARKNGKSTWLAAVLLYLAFSDEVPGGETGAEVYSAATKRDQARIIHGEAMRMVRKSAILRRNGVQLYKDSIFNLDRAQKFEPLGADSDTMDGLNVHAAGLDELHAHKKRDVWDVLETATGSRRQPMILAISTAGTNRMGVCFEKHEYTRRVLDRIVEDDTWFGIIYTLDEGDDWRDENVWIKANPNLGVSKKWGDMRTKAERAKSMTSALNAFKQKELNIWVQGEIKWMNMDAWRLCRGPVEALELPAHLAGRTCYSGLDLSSISDLSALVHVFPPLTEEEPWFVICRFWVPEDNLIRRVKDDAVPYNTWQAEGYLTATPGSVIDYDWILEEIEQDAEQFQVMGIPYDRWNAETLRQMMIKKGLTMDVFPFGQGYQSMSPPMKELERLVIGKKLAHGDNPILTWMADNLIARTDPAGNIKADKERSKEKIDGIVALLMGLGWAMRNQGETVGSVYDERGLRKL
jgi:phage terminase large subunit-like protein